MSCHLAPLTARTVVLIAALTATEARAGEDQDFEDFFGGYRHRIEGVTMGAGDAAASNTAAQIINPWPPYSQDRHILSESQRMVRAIRRYQTNSGAKPLSAQEAISTGTGAKGDPAAAADKTSPGSAE